MQKIGIDIIENKRINLHNTFIKKVLSIEEIKLFESLISKQNRRQFLAGRWAVKEAIWKASFSHEQLPFSQINISYNDDSPVITNARLSKILISISHEKKYSVGMAVNCND